MNIGIDLITTNLATNFEILILVLITFGSLIFFASDFKLGVILLFFGHAMAFMLSYALNLNYAPSLIATFISLVIMTLTLYVAGRGTPTGGLT